MKLIDERLILLHHYLSDHEFSRNDVARYLQITPRQLSRLMKSWVDDNIIYYDSGVGRGNKSTIRFKIEIEPAFINHVLNHLDTYAIDDLNRIMNLPISRTSRAVLENVIEKELYKGCTTRSAVTLLDYIYRIPATFEPSAGIDVAAGMLLTNTTDRLYELRPDGTVERNLVAYDRWEDDGLVIYLHHDIKYYDGQLLFAVDVVRCLGRLLGDSNYRYQFRDIIDIQLTGNFSFKIRTRQTLFNLKHLLAHISASIYKYDDGEMLGTGQYYIDSQSDVLLKLKDNPHHYRTPDITDIVLVNDLDRYYSYYEDKQMISMTHRINTSFIVFNPDSRLTAAERHTLAVYIRRYLAETIEATELNIPRWHEGMTHGTAPEPFEASFVMPVIDSKNNVLERLYDYLKDAGFNIERLDLKFDDFVEMNLTDMSVDFLWYNDSSKREQLYWHLISQSKVSPWLLKLQDSHELTAVYETQPQQQWISAEQRYEQQLLADNRLILINDMKKRYMLPAGYKNLQITPLGIVKYGEIIVEE